MTVILNITKIDFVIGKMSGVKNSLRIRDQVMQVDREEIIQKMEVCSILLSFFFASCAWRTITNDS